jgi:hypothetical protein
VKLVPQLLDCHRPVIEFGQIVVGRAQVPAGVYRHVRDHNAMLVPKILNLPLTGIEKTIEIVHEQHALAWGVRWSAPTEPTLKPGSRTG